MTAELVVAVPALLLLLLVIAQFAIWAHASHVAQTAASQALSSTRVQGATNTDGRQHARAVLAQLGGGPLHSAHVAVSRDAEQSSVEVAGYAARVIPFLDLRVSARAVGPNERFVEPEASP
ncbi:TadE/TadG family type IV pilus assembly protein [Saccharomonospora sp. CUA-673]|uniref:TadE/TadG family type IV pilus assembly protein n=1 Tax=Saccharomonospora sp. CUA-673 TaxID=1904969 RepID=UPI0021013289|nr:TadE/TadG family type IV pilus assembly protein [Saccharomonospora sp. CUA-673]